MKGININPQGQASYTVRKEASRSPSLVVSFTGHFQRPYVFTVVCPPPPPCPNPRLFSAQLCSAVVVAGQADGWTSLNRQQRRHQGC
ncbi:hypothetical protein PBY51_019875 [Eleginops maclovinus]|uniref:Uncharacterized protein n=1 Tax=Eleginops maclovinus TaxID=56733 RepID=A0AAN7XRU7_ELEMC|nr:hypothetical protein PBY51_019875 [Eleginops maclovinus]